MELITLILIALNSLLDIFLSVGVGVFISFMKVGTKQFKRELSGVAFNIFLPCLMFSSVVISLDMSKSKVLLQKFFVVFFYGAFTQGVGFIIGWLCFPTAIFGAVLSKISIFAVTFGNTTTLPLMFANVICGTVGLFNIDSSSSKEQNRAQALLLGATYVSSLFASFAVVFWTLGYIYYSDPRPKQKVKAAEKPKETATPNAYQQNELGKEKQFVDGNTPVLPVYDTKEAINEPENDEIDENEEQFAILGDPKRKKNVKIPSKFSDAISTIKESLKKILRFFAFLRKMYNKAGLGNVISPPLVSLILGFICACINPVRSFLVVNPYPGVQAIMHVMSETGSMYAKCALLALGMSLYDSFFTPVPRKPETPFSQLSLPKKAFFIAKKGHRSIFPYTNFVLVLMTVFLRQIAVPLIVLFFTVGYFYLGMKYMPAQEDTAILSSIIRFLLTIVPSNDPVLIFILVLCSCTPTSNAASLVSILKNFGEAPLGEIIMYQYLLSPPILVAFTSLALYLSCSISEKCY